jgi:hypothetical protein
MCKQKRQTEELKMQQVVEAATIDNDFIDFIATAKEDAAVAEQLNWVLSFDSVERRVVLGTLIGRMSQGEAPSYLVNSMRLLLNDSIADCARELLSDGMVVH